MATDPFPAEPLPGFKPTDLSLLAGSIVTAPLSWVTPERFWKIYTFPAALLKACLSFKRTSWSIRHIKLIADGSIGTLEATLIEIRIIAGNIECNFHYFREFSPRGWQPQIRVVGREYIEDALKAGRGGILCVAPFLGLLGRGIGLDSIEVLQLVTAIEKEFDFTGRNARILSR